MKKERIARIQDLVGLVHSLYPPALAEEWDNVGLQVGEAAAELKAVLVCLDPNEKALDAAVAAGAQAIVAHHPLLFRPLRNLTSADETGRFLFRAVRAGIAVLCAHTNLDRGRDGLNDWLAVRLGVAAGKPLAAGGDRQDASSASSRSGRCARDGVAFRAASTSPRSYRMLRAPQRTRGMRPMRPRR
jgi:dinuclear metal center YbgI/SA1388 family protein